MLNYKVGNFPLTYLDFLFADRKLSISDWEGLVGTEGHRVDQGRSQDLIIGGARR
jgi:hypothetical protein